MRAVYCCYACVENTSMNRSSAPENWFGVIPFAEAGEVHRPTLQITLRYGSWRVASRGSLGDLWRGRSGATGCSSHCTFRTCSHCRCLRLFTRCPLQIVPVYWSDRLNHSMFTRTVRYNVPSIQTLPFLSRFANKPFINVPRSILSNMFSLRGHMLTINMPICSPLHSHE